MHICVQFFWITWWHSTILFNNFRIIFLFLLSLCSRIWFGTRGSSCQAPLFCCFHATLVAVVLFGIGYKNTQGEILSFLCSPPVWLVWACRGHGAMTMVVALCSWPLCHVYAWLGCCSQSLHDGAVILCLFVRLSVSLVIIMLSVAYLMQT